MARRSKYSKWGLIAIAGGISLTAIEVVGAVGYLVSQDQPSYLVAGGALVTVVAAILPILAGRCWRDRRRALALMLWVSMVPALSLIFTAAVERTGGARDQGDRDRQVIAQRIELTKAAVNDAKADVEATEAKAAAECSKAPVKGVDPRGPLCKAAESRVTEARTRLQVARGEVAQAGVVPADPQARRIAAILPVSEEAVKLYQPLVLPVAISVLGLLLISAGAHRPKRKAQKRKGKRKPRRRLGNAKPRAKALPNPLPANVVALPRRA
jgi:hypothetical protein